MMNFDLNCLLEVPNYVLFLVLYCFQLQIIVEKITLNIFSSSLNLVYVLHCLFSNLQTAFLTNLSNPYFGPARPGLQGLCLRQARSLDRTGHLSNLSHSVPADNHQSTHRQLTWPLFPPSCCSHTAAETSALRRVVTLKQAGCSDNRQTGTRSGREQLGRSPAGQELCSPPCS